jgi:Uma2 family endonuclease
VQESPTVLFEVLSPSTRRVDEGEKLQAYLSIRSLKAYMLIESEVLRVTIWRQKDGAWSVAHFTNLADIIELEFIACRLPLGELYNRVKWD